MYRKLVFIVAIVASLALAWPALAQGPDNDTKHSDPTWSASYWNNTSLSGVPIVTAQEPTLAFDWGGGSPYPKVQADGFSARWTRYLYMAQATYRFTTLSDDGVRLYMDGRLVIDQWNDHAARTDTVDLALSAGHHAVVVEYYERGGAALVSVTWSPLSGSGGWAGEYYDNTWLGGSPDLVRQDPRLDFDWGYGSPAAGIPSDSFSARWSRTVSFEPGQYTFTAAADDGVRLYVNGHLLIDEWKAQSWTTYSESIYLSGETPVVLEYFEQGGVAAVRLSWALGGQEPVPSGEVIVDNGDAGFRRGGSTTAWHGGQGGIGGGYIWTRNNDRVRADYNWARWYPGLNTTGSYEVYVYVPDGHATTGNARYWVSHRDGFTLCVVDQGANRGRWVSLGTFRFRGTGADYVSLADVTYEPYLWYDLAFDAVKWAPR